MRRGVALALAGMATLAVAAPAQASFHLMSIREVSPNPAGPDTAYIELQMYAAGQNFVNGHSLTTYTSTGSVLSTTTFSANVPNGENQRTILIGDTLTAGSPDLVYMPFADALMLYGPGGAACWDIVDCVSWGNFSGAGALPSPTGTPAPAIPNGQALVRSIAPGCATLLESADDTNNSSADFALGTPSPRNNSVAPTEHACTGGGNQNGAPDTTITKGPESPTSKTKAKFKFKSTIAGSTFECKLDKDDFEGCKSPAKYKHLDQGKHKFKVRAVLDGLADPSPAKLKWKVVD